MSLSLRWTFFLVLPILVWATSSRTFQRVCYYALETNANSSAYLPVYLINGTLCTHLIVGFASVSESGVIHYTEDEERFYRQIITHRNEYYPHLTVMLSIGGGDREAGFHEAVATETSRSKFINSILEVITKYSFDGIDLDWEFPAWSKYEVDRDNFVELLRGLRKFFNFYSFKSGKKYFLSVAVSPSYTIINVSYNVTAMEPLVDFINLMSYDFHQYSSVFPFVEYNAPLFRRETEDGFLSTFNTAWAAAYWNDSGMPKEKIMIGIPSYTHNYILFAKNSVTPGSPADGESPEFTYSETCLWLSNLSTGYVYDQEAKVPYAFNDRLWSSFEDRKSVFAKASFIKENDYGGSMLYNLNCDDFSYACLTTHRFVLQTIIYNVLTSP